MHLWIYTPFEHVPCGVLDNYTGLSITHKAIKNGEIEFFCHLDDTSKQIQESSIIWPQGDATAFIVTTCEQSKQDNGEEVVQVKGACLKWILRQRKTKKQTIYQGTCGAVMNQMLAELTGNRAFPRFSAVIDNALGADITITVPQDSYNSTFQAICEASGLNMQITWNATQRTLVLTVSAGADRSIGNTDGNTPILFDETLETMQGIEYTRSIADSKNVMYIVDADDMVQEVGETESSGYERFEECTMDSGGREVTNADGSTTTLTDAEYAQKKIEAAQKELDKLRPVKSATGDLPAEEALIAYGVDYHLGDIVTARKKPWDMNVSVRITGDTLREKNGILTRQLTIGDPLLTVAERIKMR